MRCSGRGHLSPRPWPHPSPAAHRLGTTQTPSQSFQIDIEAAQTPFWNNCSKKPPAQVQESLEKEKKEARVFKKKKKMTLVNFYILVLKRAQAREAKTLCHLTNGWSYQRPPDFLLYFCAWNMQPRLSWLCTDSFRCENNLKHLSYKFCRMCLFQSNCDTK